MSAIKLNKLTLHQLTKQLELRFSDGRVSLLSVAELRQQMTATTADPTAYSSSLISIEPTEYGVSMLFDDGMRIEDCPWQQLYHIADALEADRQ